ncbi:MAG: hypothetical protein KDB79_02530 [Acidobacteria bacterium]|nr:hypothetical protein [Acidobacteriota bacterium]
MPIWLKAAGKWGSIFAILALVITLLKQVIGFISFLTMAIKVIVVLVFVALLIGVGLLVVKSLQGSKKNKS